MRILALTAAALIATTGIASAGSKGNDSRSYREAFSGFANGNVGPGNTGRNNVGSGNSGNGNVGSYNGGNANVGSHNGFQSSGRDNGNHNIGSVNGAYSSGDHNGNHNIGSFNGSFKFPSGALGSNSYLSALAVTGRTRWRSSPTAPAPTGPALPPALLVVSLETGETRRSSRTTRRSNRTRCPSWWTAARWRTASWTAGGEAPAGGEPALARPGRDVPLPRAAERGTVWRVRVTDLLDTALAPEELATRVASSRRAARPGPGWSRGTTGGWWSSTRRATRSG